MDCGKAPGYKGNFLNVLLIVGYLYLSTHSTGIRYGIHVSTRLPIVQCYASLNPKIEYSSNPNLRGDQIDDALGGDTE